MTDTLIIQRAIEELEAKNFGLTKQFLDVHQIPFYADGKPIIAKVDTEKADGTAVVYFPVVGQKFYLSIFLDTMPVIYVRWVDIAPYHQVYFRASSDKLSLQDLSAMTKLISTRSRNKGDMKLQNGGSGISWKRSSVDFEPDAGAGEFETKLTKLLDFLEQDKTGVQTLVKEANGYIQVYSSIHNGNTLLGGHHLDRGHIKRMSDLNLEIDLDISAEGNFFN